MTRGPKTTNVWRNLEGIFHSLILITTRDPAVAHKGLNSVEQNQFYRETACFQLLLQAGSFQPDACFLLNLFTTSRTCDACQILHAARQPSVCDSFCTKSHEACCDFPAVVKIHAQGLGVLLCRHNHCTK